LLISMYPDAIAVYPALPRAPRCPPRGGAVPREHAARQVMAVEVL